MKVVIDNINDSIYSLIRVIIFQEDNKKEYAN